MPSRAGAGASSLRGRPSPGCLAPIWASARVLRETTLPGTSSSSASGGRGLSHLERLEDPRRQGPWDRRGMVVGDVQSGKTSNYSGLICKAADAGYAAIIILAGMHNNLRSQTQERIDTGLLGFDTERNMKYDNSARWVGVGLLNQSEFRNLPIMALTNSKAKGDFKRPVAESLGLATLGGTPVVFVVKKNKSVLENLCQWLTDRA